MTKAVGIFKPVMNIEFVNSIKKYNRISLGIEWHWERHGILLLWLGLIFFEIWIWRR